MAEAHAAVAFQFNVSRHGLTVDYDKEILRELIHSTKRSWRYRLIRFLVSEKYVNGQEYIIETSFCRLT